MGGSKNEYRGSYATRRALYRDVRAADSDPVLESIPEINVAGSAYGKDGTLFISAVLMDGATGADVEIWMKADQEVRPSPYPPFNDSSSSSSSSLSGTKEWVRVKKDSITSSALVVATPIPAGKFKALVTSITGGGMVRLLEQHAE